jgi:hypothetical protein
MDLQSEAVGSLVSSAEKKPSRLGEPYEVLAIRIRPFEWSRSVWRYMTAGRRIKCAGSLLGSPPAPMNERLLTGSENEPGSDRNWVFLAAELTEPEDFARTCEWRVEMMYAGNAPRDHG